MEINEQEAIFTITIFHSLFSCETLSLALPCLCKTHQQNSYPSTIKLRTNDKHVRYGKQLNLILRQSNLMSFNLTWISCLSSRFCVLSFLFFVIFSTNKVAKNFLQWDYIKSTCAQHKHNLVWWDVHAVFWIH